MKPTEADMIFTNAKVVLDDRVIERGWVAIAHRGIVEIGEGKAPERGEDFGGDLLWSDRTAHRSSRSALRAAAEGVLGSRRRGRLL